MKKVTIPQRKWRVIWVVIIALLLIGVLSIDNSPKSQSQKSAYISKNIPLAVHSDRYNQVSNWTKQYGSFIQTIQTDNNSARDASSNNDYASLEEACNKESQDITTIQAFPVVPDAIAAAHMKSMLSNLIAYTTNCIDGSHDAQVANINGDASLMEQSATELQNAAKNLSSAVADMDAFNSSLQAIINDN